MAADANKWIKEIVAIAGAILAMFLLDWIIPGGSIFPDIYNLTWQKIKYIGIAVVLLVILLGTGITWGIYKGEKKWKFAEIKERAKRALRNQFWDIMDEYRARLGIMKKAWTRRRLTPDMLPKILRENIVILFSLSNYLKRLYIWYVKWGQVNNAKHICELMYELIGQHDDFDKLELEIYQCRNGIIIDKELELEPEDPSVVHKCPECNVEFRGSKSLRALEEHLISSHGMGEGDLENVGLFDATRKYCMALNQISEMLSNYLSAIITGMSAAQIADFNTKATNYRKTINRAVTNVQYSVTQLTNRASAYGNYMPIKAQKYLVLDQCNPYGETAHEYKFVPGDTEFEGTPFAGAHGHGNHPIEVNLYGEVLEDMNLNKDGFFKPKDPTKEPRKVKPHEMWKIKDLEPPHEIMEAIDQDWDGFIRNMRYGQFRYHSKSVKDYIKALSTNDEESERLGKLEFRKESKINSSPGWKDADNPAFDRRALVNTGLLTYPGRVKWESTFLDVVNHPIKDQYPAVSSLGMSMYLPVLVTRDTEDLEEMNRYLSAIPRDTGVQISKGASKAEAAKVFGTMHTLEEKH